MVQFPVSVAYTPANVPGWIAVIPENPDVPWELKITLEDWSRIRFDETNIEGLFVDLPKAVADTGLSVADVQAIIAFIRFTTPKLTLILNGTGVDNIEIVLPPGLSVFEVRKATGELVPFFFNVARNSIVVTVEFASTVQLELLVASVQSVLNRAIQAITSIMVVTSVLTLIFSELGKIMREVRERA